MNLRDEPHYRITSKELANWLIKQGEDRWWTVDGDPLLMGELSLPCPADELAAELRRMNRTLLVLDRRSSPSGKGETITAKEFDALATRFGDNVKVEGTPPVWVKDRLFVLCWEDQPDDEWMLVEDETTTEQSRKETLAQGRER